MMAYRTRFESPTMPDEIDPNDPLKPSARRRETANEAETDDPEAPDGGLTAATDGVGAPQFVGSDARSCGSPHNFGIPIHNSWDETSRNLRDSSIIYGTAPQSAPLRRVLSDRPDVH